ncbi:hypothetical protein AAFF_G00384150 [Aldrovandia affinis]|uniref:Uncharacterized protein n=1 Tax=Aldrovandia affinis TaxID=143900 RepID=A0AAD7SHE5_9TELE|nr:hypothetical protein AAFF_G00384150 [Aldrovandia affinis]
MEKAQAEVWFPFGQQAVKAANLLPCHASAGAGSGTRGAVRGSVLTVYTAENSGGKGGRALFTPSGSFRSLSRHGAASFISATHPPPPLAPP